MFPKKNRLKLKKDFDNIFKTGQSCFGQFMGIKVINNNLGYNRFAIIISNKVDKKAVTRNKIRKQLFGIIKEKQKSFKNYLDCVIIVLPDIKKANKTEIENDLNNIFLSLKL